MAYNNSKIVLDITVLIIYYETYEIFEIFEIYETFENIMFSTRVIITKKEDFIDFLGKLVEHGFTEMALTYLESALNIYPSEKALVKLLEKLTQGELIED